MSKKSKIKNVDDFDWNKLLTKDIDTLHDRPEGVVPKKLGNSVEEILENDRERGEDIERVIKKFMSIGSQDFNPERTLNYLSFLVKVPESKAEEEKLSKIKLEARNLVNALTSLNELIADIEASRKPKQG